MSPARRKLLVATTHLKKLKEIQALLSDLPFDLLTLKDLPGYQEVPETGNSFEENAKLKALGYGAQSGLLTLAEDSGLCCDALEGAPGIYSARFAGEGRDDEENNQKLLRLLDKVPDNCRGAHYACAAVLAKPEKILRTFQGDVHGSIAKAPAGRNGFGYDPIFFYPPFQKTFGQASPEMKAQVSHRSKALRMVKDYLQTALEKTGSRG